MSNTDFGKFKLGYLFAPNIKKGMLIQIGSSKRLFTVLESKIDLDRVTLKLLKSNIPGVGDEEDFRVYLDLHETELIGVHIPVGVRIPA